MTNHHTTITTVAALSFTGLAVGLAIASSLDRAPAGHAAVLLAGLSAAIVLAVHLAPALLRSVPQLILWPFWSLCLVAALWAHVGFLTATAADASAARLASSPITAAAAAQRADIQAAFDQIKARPAPNILRQMSWTTDAGRTAALQAELQAAKRREALQDQLLALSAAATTAATATADPVSGWLAAALGISASTVQLAAGLLLALLIEFIGMLLWLEVRSSSSRSNDRAEIVHADTPRRHVLLPSRFHADKWPGAVADRRALSIGACRAPLPVKPAVFVHLDGEPVLVRVVARGRVFTECL